jgi:hypothetical protein
VGAPLALARLGAFHLEEQHRRAAFQAHDFQLQAGHLLRFHPGGGVAQHGVEQALLPPSRGEHGRLGGMAM